MEARLLAVAAAVALSLLGDATMYAVLPSRAESVGVSVGLLGVILSANRFVRLLTNTWAGRICDKHGRRIPFFAALIVGAAITAGYGVARGFFAFLMLRILWGFCWSFLRLEWYQTAYETSSSSNIGRVMGTSQSIVRIGTLAGSVLGGVLTDAIGFSRALFAFAAIGLTGAAVAARRPPPRGARCEPTSAIADPDAIADGDIAEYATDDPPAHARLLRARRVAVCWVGFCSLFAISSIVVATLGRLLLVRLGATIPVLGLTLGVASLTGILIGVRPGLSLVLSPVFGHASDVLGRRLVIVAALLVAIACHVLLAGTTHLALIVGAVLLLAVAAAAVAPALDATVRDLTTDRDRARFVSTYVTLLDLGSACGPLVGLAIAAAWGLASAYLVAAASVVSSAVVYLIAFRARVEQPGAT